MNSADRKRLLTQVWDGKAKSCPRYLSQVKALVKYYDCGDALEKVKMRNYPNKTKYDALGTPTLMTFQSQNSTKPTRKNVQWSHFDRKLTMDLQPSTRPNPMTILKDWHMAYLKCWRQKISQKMWWLRLSWGKNWKEFTLKPPKTITVTLYQSLQGLTYHDGHQAKQNHGKQSHKCSLCN